MSTAPPGRKAIWILPIVIAICAVMVLPAGTFLVSSAHGGNPMASAAGVSSMPTSSASTPLNAPGTPHLPGGTSSLPSLSQPSTSQYVSPGSKNLEASPSAYAPTSGLASLASELPSYLQNAKWLQSALHPGSGAPSVASLPNLNELIHPPTVSGGVVYPGYTTEPAPLGLTDYGLGATPYAYNTSHIAGSVTFTAAPNVTQPAATNVIGPSSHAERDGEVGSEYEFGIQLNTVGSNLTIPGTNDTDMGEVWAQNVANWNSTGIHFIQDTWNASYDSYIAWGLNSIYSGCGGNTAWANYDVFIYGVFQCSEGNVPISANDYPVTLTLYNNFSVNAQNRAQLVYGYSIYEAGSSTFLSGVADTVVFNNTAGGWQTPTAPPFKPGNIIDPFQPMPANGLGEQQDAEIDIVGGIEGDNGVFSQINGTVTLQYSNQSSGGWQNVPSAYNYGSDTGETSMGIADYWTPGHTLVINQGPSMLYGLWNAVPKVSVKSGDIQIAGTISPSYGFVFVSNIPAVVNPWGGVQRDNMSWLPTTSTGTFDTYLPPLGAPWTTTYYTQAFADGYAEYNGTVTASTTSLGITMTAKAGVVNAPIYFSTPAQAGALANALGAPTTSAPYVFDGITVDVNFTFSLVNDWLFPSFEIFQSQGVNDVQVTDLYQGTDSNNYGPSYIWDIGLTTKGVVYPTSPPINSAKAGFFVPTPLTFTDTYGYLSGINIFYGTHDLVTLQVLSEDTELINTSLYDIHAQWGEFGTLGDPGWQLTLWGDTDAVVNDVFTIFEYPGVWVGDSTDTFVGNSTAEYGYGVTDQGGHGTTVWNLAVEDALGVDTVGSFDSVYSWINVTDYGEGVEAGSDYGSAVLYAYDIPGSVGLTVNDLNVTNGGLGANITFSQHTTFNDLSTYDNCYDLYEEYCGGGAAWLDGTWGTNFNTVTVYGGEAWGVDMWNASYTNITNYLLTNSIDTSAIWEASDYTTVTGLAINTYYEGVYGWDLTNTLFADTTVIGTYQYSEYFEEYFYDEFAVFLEVSTATTISDWNQSGYAGFGAGAIIADSSGVTLSNIVGWGYPAVLTEVTTSITGTGILGANDGDAAVTLGDGSGATVTGVDATDFSTGLAILNFFDATVTDLDSYDYGEGAVDVDDGSTLVSVSGVTASNSSIGAIVGDASNVQITDVTVTGLSIGVVLGGSQMSTISGVTATGTTLETPFFDDPWDVPISAVVTEETAGVTVTNVVAKLYPAALMDDDSTGLTGTAINATDGYYGIVLDETANSLFSGVGAYGDLEGAVLEGGADENTITASSFVDDTSYGVAITSGEFNTVWGNNFIGDNGATGTYSAAHIQAESGGVNYFDLCTNSACTTGIGNYWADWHTYGSNGALAPYLVTGSSYDYFPTGAAETFVISFTATGLAAGASWSVTLSGVTLTSTTDAINFTVPMGSYVYQVNPVAGYSVTPTSGTITESGTAYSVPVTFSATTFAVTLNAGGLSAGTSWSATVNGVMQSTTGATLTFYLPAGAGYKYAFNSVSGYNLPTTGASGAFNVTDAPVSLATTYSPVSSPSYVQTNAFDDWFAVAIAVAVIALVIGLLALFLRGRKESPPPQGAQPWTPPPSSAGGASGGSPPPAAGSSGAWSEGPPSSGGSPPS